MSVDCADGEPIDVNSLARRRARIPHRCDCCDELVPRGHFYFRQFVVWDGSHEVIVRCARCQQLYETLCASHPADEETAVAWRLDCGHSYKAVYGVDPPPEVAALAFQTAEEAQAALARSRKLTP